MEFDKSKVYTAVNADELPIGSKCIFADTIRGLRRKVGEEKDTNCAETFYRLHNDGGDDLFVGNDCAYCYAYLIEPLAEPKYKPFSNTAKAMEAIKKHGGWVKERLKVGERQCLITVRNFGFEGADEIFLNGSWLSRYELFHGFVFADDGSPCGELVEE